MNKKTFPALAFLWMPILLAGCSPVDAKAANISLIYGAAAVLSGLLLICYCSTVRKKDPWFLLLFASVLVVNIGYFTLSISRNLEEALLANRIAYLGSVFLPMSMLLIILNVTGLRRGKWLPWLLLGLGILVFLVAASPGYLNIYYQEVDFQVIDGVSSLRKVYGPWHCLYLFYLLGYSAMTVWTVVLAAVKRKLDSPIQATILLAAVFANIGVWFIEQLVSVNFEILSISYIISEMFLLGLHFIMQENARLKAQITQQPAESPAPPAAEPEKEIPAPNAAPEDPPGNWEFFTDGMATLTKTERAIFDRYVAGLTTKEIMTELNIKENTLKFHNKNIYSKLGVSSRKQLMEIHRQIQGSQNSPADKSV